MGNKRPSLSLNFIMNILLTMSSFIFPLITFPYVSRVLGAEGTGKIQMATSFISYFTLCSQLGIPTYGIKACSALRYVRKALSKTVHELLIISAVTTLISYIVFFILLWQIPHLREEKLLYLVTSSSVFLTMVGMEWLFKAAEQYRYITIRSLVFKAISVIAMFLLVHRKEDYIIYAIISVTAAAGSYLMNLTQLPKYVDLKPIGGYNIRQHLKPVFVLFAYTCATTIYTNLDAVMLGFIATETDVGYYSVAIKIKNILVSIVTAIGAVLLPRVSYYYKQGNLDDFWKTISKSMHFVLLVSAPLVIYFILFAKPAILFIAGDGYAPSVLPMMWIMPTLLLIGMTYVMGMEVLIPMGKETLVLWASVAAAVVDVIINALLIPGMQATGAAIGTLLAEIVVFIIQYVYLRKKASVIFGGIPLFAIGAAVLLSGLASFWVSRLDISYFFILAISAVIFFGSYLLALHIFKDSLLKEGEHILVQKIRKVLHKD